MTTLVVFMTAILTTGQVIKGEALPVTAIVGKETTTVVVKQIANSTTIIQLATTTVTVTTLTHHKRTIPLHLTSVFK